MDTRAMNGRKNYRAEYRQTGKMHMMVCEWYFAAKRDMNEDKETNS